MPAPPDDKFRQQKLDMWQPIMTPWKVITIFLAIGIAFVPAGVGLLAKSNNIYESTFEYDDGTSSSTCRVNSKNKQNGCDVTFTIRRKIDEPLYVYYELTNFYQNHRRYVNSRNVYQLQGQDISKADLELTCDPTTTSGNMTLNPCGLIANSFFNDLITLSTSTSSPADQFSMDESNIAWDSDKDKFKQISGFEYQSVACNNKQCDATVFPNGCKFYLEPITNECYAYYYPNDDTVKYLYESYPDIISPIEGVTNEHFMVWMRTAALPTFRKLYGKINGPFLEGDILRFKIKPYFEVDSFDGTKSIVISTLNNLGGKNPYLGVAYIVVGSLSLLFGVLFAVKQILMPRTCGAPELLRWT